MIKSLTNALKKYGWIVLAAIGMVVFRDTVLSVIQWILVIALVCGILFFLLKIPGVRTRLRGIWPWFKAHPLVAIIILAVLLVVVILVIIFFPHSATPTGQLQQHQQQPAVSVPVLLTDDVEFSYAVNTTENFASVNVYSDVKTARDNPVVISSEEPIDFTLKAVALNGQKFYSGGISLTTVSTGEVQANIWGKLNSSSVLEQVEFSRTTVECIVGESYLYEFKLNDLTVYISLKVVKP